MGVSWDPERGAKAGTWSFFFIVCYLLMALSCEVGFPTNCTRASEPLEVLTDLIFLIGFAVSQAFLCDMLDPIRAHALARTWYFFFFILASAVVTSALMMDDGFENLHDSGGDFTPAEAAASILLLLVVIAVFIYHYFLAWKVLPGAWLGWGLSSGQVEETPPSHAENRFLQYFIMLVFITVYVVLYSSFAYSRGDGWDYHFVLLSWVMSLIASFDDYISVTWLAITTGVFLQGVGAYSFQSILGASMASD